MITVVTGPPCGGKTTFVEQNYKSGDIVIDMDKIALSLTTPDIAPYEYSDHVREVAIAARAAAVKTAVLVAQGQRNLGIWIIHSDPSISYRQGYRAMGAKFQECDPGKAECLKRLKDRPRVSQVGARKAIDAYYAKR